MDFYIGKTPVGQMEKLVKKDARVNCCIGLFTIINLNAKGIGALLDAYDGSNKVNLKIGEVNFFDAICLSLRIGSDEKADVEFFFLDTLSIL